MLNCRHRALPDHPKMSISNEFHPVARRIAEATIEAFDAHYAELRAYGRRAKALFEAGAVQCGYCIPGMVMSATALMETETTFDDEIVREYMDGNLCRCTGYEKIWGALRRVLDRQEAKSST